MKETTLNAKLVKSIGASFEGVHVQKRHGSIFSKSMPDIEGTMLGVSFYIEGKMGTIPKNENSLVIKGNQFTPGQKNKILDLIKSSALVMLALYIYEKNQKGVYLLPLSKELCAMIFSNKITLSALHKLRPWWVPYEKQSFNVKHVFAGNITAHLLFLEPYHKFILDNAFPKKKASYMDVKDDDDIHIHYGRAHNSKTTKKPN